MLKCSPDAAEVGCFRLPQLMMAELGNTRVLQHEVMRRRSGVHCQSHNVSQWVPVLQRTVARCRTRVFPSSAMINGASRKHPTCAAPGTRERSTFEGSGLITLDQSPWSRVGAHVDVRVRAVAASSCCMPDVKQWRHSPRANRSKTTAGLHRLPRPTRGNGRRHGPTRTGRPSSTARTGVADFLSAMRSSCQPALVYSLVVRF
jgi:hypothetical protein